eukprot:SAG31_NODE_12559_length_932_cov_1.535414_1_plen_97_part_01
MLRKSSEHISVHWSICERVCPNRAVHVHGLPNHPLSPPWFVRLDMIPLMMEPNYRPRGWLGIILGSRLYYAFYGGLDARAFKERMDALVREIGVRGR